MKIELSVPEIKLLLQAIDVFLVDLHESDRSPKDPVIYKCLELETKLRKKVSKK